MIQFAIYTTPGGTLVGDYSNRIQKLSFATNAKGFAECSGFIPMPLAESFLLYDRVGVLHVQMADSGSTIIYEGRLEDVEITNGGVNLRAFGYSRALSDEMRTLLWSTTSSQDWKAMPSDVGNFGNRTPEKYSFDFNNHVQIALQKNAIYTNNSDVGQAYYSLPNNGSRDAVTISFDWVAALPSNFYALVQVFQEDWTYIGGYTLWIGFGGNAPGAFVQLALPTGSRRVSIMVFNNSGANYTNTNESGVWFFRANNIRVTSASTNAVNTTTTALISYSGTPAVVSVAVVTTANMYAGQRVYLKATGSPNLGVGGTVQAVTDATHFTVIWDTSSFSAASGAEVQAAVIYAQEIVYGIALGANALNPTQLSASLVSVQNPLKDVLDFVPQDQYLNDLMDQLVALGDNQTPPRQWEWGVDVGRYLYFRPQSSAARTWYVDISEIDIQRTIDSLYNAIYATYQESSGRTLRTAVSSDATSIARYRLTRKKAQPTQTASSLQAITQRDAALADSKDPKPRSGLTVKFVFDTHGSTWPTYLVRAGDTIVIRNLPPILSTAIDQIRTFRIARTEYDFAGNSVTIEPENPLSTLDALLSLATAPSWVTTPWWVQVGQV